MFHRKRVCLKSQKWRFYDKKCNFAGLGWVKNEDEENLNLEPWIWIGFGKVGFNELGWR